MGRRIEGLGFGTLAVDTIRVVRSLPKGEVTGENIRKMRGSQRYPSTISDAFKLFKRLAWRRK